MNSRTPRRLTVRGSLADGTRVAIDIAQARDAAHATGSLRVDTPEGGTLLSATELGVLQTAAGWASVTARIAPRQAGGGAGFVTVIVERADPFVDGHPATVTLDVDNAGAITTVVRTRSAPLVLR